MPRRTIADIAADALAAHGPLPLAELTAHVVADGGTKAKDPQKAVSSAIEYASQVSQIPGDLYASTRGLCRGRVFTRRLTAEELASERLATRGDLDPLRLPIRETLSSNRGDLIIHHGSHEDFADKALTGPTGWLAGTQSGDLVAVAYDGSALDISLVDEVTAEPLVDRRLVAAFRQGLDEEQEWVEQPTVPLAFQVHGVLASDPSAFTRPGLPLSERLAGLEVHNDLVGYAGTEWSDVDWWDHAYEDNACEDEEAEFNDESLDDYDVAADFRLTGAAAEALRELVDAVEHVEMGGLLRDDKHTRRLAEQLPLAAPAFRAWCQVEGAPTAVARLAEFLTTVSEGPTASTAWTIVASSREELGEHADADEAIANALRADPADDEAHLIAARYASDRGDAKTAMLHLRAAHVASNDPEMQRLRVFAEPPASTVGRNAPCPCGSGKKHKLCCLADARHPLATRSPWLWQKIAQWAREPRQREAILTVAQALAPDDQRDQLLRALHDAVTADLAVWGLGLLQEFIANRGPVLPSDERELLDSWVKEPIRIVEVVAVAPGRVTLFDRETDETFTARDKLLSAGLEAGEVLVTRLLPNGGGEHLISFAIDVPPLQRSRLTIALREQESSERAVAGWYASATRPPDIVDREGNELVVCSGTWSLPDPVAAEALLDEHGVLYDGDRKLAMTTIEGDELDVTCLSRELWDRTQAVLSEALPGAVLLHSEEQDPTSPEMPTLPPGAPDAPLTPELQQALREYIEDYERSWVEESIPALGGMTPREALEDPTKRRDLMYLLDDMPDVPGGMSADRIRQLLGLD
ncbi:MAG: tetratricopeptide repeat family protein [Frankiales bacterium]|nr:tetratricopeptide repeat family protein [Frankiales bacterium]